MDRLGTVLLGLVAEGRSQRAVVETMLDIRAEQVEARGAWTRIRWSARSTTAIARVVVRILPRELGGVIVGGWTVRLGAWTLLLALPLLLPPVMNWPFMNLGPGGDPRFPASTQLILFATLLPQALVLALPVAAFLAALGPSRRSPSSVAVQGVAAVAIVLALILMVPVASQVFRQTAYAASTGTTPSVGVPARGLRELTAGVLVRVAFGTNREARSARRHAVTMTGLVAAAGTFTLLGGLLARRARLIPAPRAQRRWPYAFGIPGLTLLLSAALGIGVGSWAMSLIAGAAAIRVANSLPPLLGSRQSTA
jgi:hypothetical protein